MKTIAQPEKGNQSKEPLEKRQWIPTAEALKILRSLPPDPTFFEDIGEMSDTVNSLGEPRKG